MWWSTLAPRCASAVPSRRKGTFTREVTTWGATTNKIPALRDHLIAAGVSLVVAEAAGVYWKP
jgi:transposase